MSRPVLQRRQPIENSAEAGPGLDADVTPNGRQRAPQGKTLFAPAPKQRANDPPIIVQGDRPHVENDGLAPGKPRKCRDNIVTRRFASECAQSAPNQLLCCSMETYFPTMFMNSPASWRVLLAAKQLFIVDIHTRRNGAKAVLSCVWERSQAYASKMDQSANSPVKEPTTLLR